MILNSSKQRITGVVTEPDVQTEYIGTTTPTAKVTINPETKEISVDVIASGFLGETAITAYPGNDGALATKLAVKALEDVEEETRRSKQAELELKEHIESFTKTIQLGDAAVHTKVEEETKRAIIVEDTLRKNLETLAEASNTNFNTVYDKFVEVNTAIKTTRTDLSSSILQLEDDVFDELVYIKDDFASQIDDIVSDQDKFEQYAESTYAKQSDVNKLIVHVNEHVDTQLEQLNASLNETRSDLTDTINTVNIRVDNIESSYATKNYVYEEVHNAITLSKQVVDSVDLDNNNVTINNVLTTPVDGVLYMLLDPTKDVEDIYKEYTTIDGKLTLIGDTSVSLDGYATEDYVNQQIDLIPEVDLTDYAKKSEIPDVSSFIDKIPEEYITEEELHEKGYYTLAQITDLLKSIEFIDGGNAPSI